VRNPHGYAILTCDDGSREEWNTVQCNHCQRNGLLSAGVRPEDIGTRCFQCFEIICPKCAAKTECVPWEKAMERIEAGKY
jgi:hypothetical protein